MKQVSKQNAIIIFSVACLYCLNRFWLKNAVAMPVIGYLLKCHFNDYLAGIAILAYINLMLSFSKYRHKVIATFPQGIIVSLSCALLWEYILPMIFPRGTSDFYDVISYVLGSITYIGITRLLVCRNNKKEGEQRYAKNYN